MGDVIKLEDDDEQFEENEREGDIGDNVASKRYSFVTPALAEKIHEVQEQSPLEAKRFQFNAAVQNAERIRRDLNVRGAVTMNRIRNEEGICLIFVDVYISYIRESKARVKLKAKDTFLIAYNL